MSHSERVCVVSKGQHQLKSYEIEENIFIRFPLTSRPENLSWNGYIYYRERYIRREGVREESGEVRRVKKCDKEIVTFFPLSRVKASCNL